MEAYIKQLENELKEMEKYEALADEAEKKMLENPTDAKAEHDFDVYYTKEHNYWMEAVATLKVIIKCDDDTAKAMIATKRNEIKSLIAKMA